MRSLDYLKLILENIRYMYHYHSALEATHPYQSTWWMWMLDVRPILYYLHYFDDAYQVKSAIGARDDLGRPTTTALENKQHFMEYLKTLK